MSSAIRRILTAVPLILFPVHAIAANDKGWTSDINLTAILLFLLFVVATLAISYWASRRTKTNTDFYTAGGQITGLQNGTAIAGDFMSAASFLGITGLIFIGGFDGLIFAVGAFAGFPLMLFLLSERIRNLGKHTFTDVVSLRLHEKRTRIISVFTSLTIVMTYLIAQMVGVGKLIELLFGVPYEMAVFIIAGLVIVYVVFGGMLATTWVQIIKAIFLLCGSTLITVLVLFQFDWSLNMILSTAVDMHQKGASIIQPGQLISDPIQVLTILVSMVLGAMGLPHILMRLFTVSNMHEARKSSFYATILMGYFYLLLIVIGFGAVAILLQNPQYFDANGTILGGDNMVAIHLAHAVGGDWLMGFISAVAFSTILAVVAGLTVAGSATISHDLYAQVLCHNKEIDTRKELKISRITAVSLCLLTVFFAIIFQRQNVAFIAVLPFVFAACINFPILILSLYWKGMTTNGAIAGSIWGFSMSLALIIAGPQVWVQILGFATPLFPYNYPALFIMPISFLLIWLFSSTDRSARSAVDRDNFQQLLVQSELGTQRLP